MNDTNKNLTEYISICMDMEKNVYTQNEALSQLYGKKATLGHENKIVPPEEPKLTNTRKAGTAITIFMISVICTILVGLTFIKFESAVNGIPLMVFFWTAVISGFIAIPKIGDYATDKSSNKNKLDEYRKELELFKKNKAADELRVQNENMLLTVIENKISALNNVKAHTLGNLQQIYEANIIHPKYRNLNAICSFYDYFTTGRCSDLTGHEGAYNLYENELLANKIIDRLDNISSSLYQIKNNQFSLYQAIQSSNAMTQTLIGKTNEMIDEVKNQGDMVKSKLTEISKNTELTAYATERAAKELEYMNKAKYLAGDYDGIGKYMW